MNTTDYNTRIKDTAEQLLRSLTTIQMAEELAKRMIEEEDYNENKIVITDHQRKLIIGLIDKITRGKDTRGRKPKVKEEEGLF